MNPGARLQIDRGPHQREGSQGRQQGAKEECNRYVIDFNAIAM
jgi:hypothetical protein